MLDAIDALLAGRATKDQMGYSIAGRSITRIPLPEGPYGLARQIRG